MLHRLINRIAVPATVALITAAVLVGGAHAEAGPRYPSPVIQTGCCPWPTLNILPDLTVTNLVAVCEAGQVTIVFSTTNEGPIGTAGTSFTYVSLDGQVISHIQDAPLTAGQSRQHSRTANVSGNVQHSVSITVDTLHQVVESDESNNTVSTTVTIGYSGC